MDTKFIDIKALSISERELAIDEAAAVIRQGQLVAFPTETVYGLGADGLNAAAVADVFAAKGRPFDNPLILHIASEEMLDELVTDVPAQAAILMDAFWPGPLTVVLPRTGKVPAKVCAGLDTVAVRWPSNEIARQLILASRVPIAAPSANVSGKPSPTSAQAVRDDLNGKISMILDGGECSVGLESTVVDCSSAVPAVLRPGAVTLEMIEAVLHEKPDTEISASRPRAPGMKYRHYAPEAPLYLFDPDGEGVLVKIAELLGSAGEKCGFIGSSESCGLMPDNVLKYPLAARKDLSAAAAALFSALRYMDRNGVRKIYAETWPEYGIGLAIMNRLRKAATSSNITI